MNKFQEQFGKEVFVNMLFVKIILKLKARIFNEGEFSPQLNSNF